jgi:FkbM family methyltransferase
MVKTFNKIKKKILEGAFLDYILWKSGILKIKELLVKKYFNKEVNRWSADNGDTKLRLDYQFERNDLIIDIGSFTGQDLKKFLAKFKCEILGFEPDPKLFKQLTKSFNSELVKFYNFGFSDTKREAYLIDKQDRSFVKNNLPKKINNYEKIEVIKFSDFIHDNDIQKISLVNMNIEGSEYKVLKDIIETDAIQRIKTLQVQFHSAHCLLDPLRNER